MVQNSEYIPGNRSVQVQYEAKCSLRSSLRGDQGKGWRTEPSLCFRTENTCVGSRNTPRAKLTRWDNERRSKMVLFGPNFRLFVAFWIRVAPMKDVRQWWRKICRNPSLYFPCHFLRSDAAGDVGATRDTVLALKFFPLMRGGLKLGGRGFVIAQLQKYNA